MAATTATPSGTAPSARCSSSPATWRIWGADGNGDGVADPQNIEDAALAAAGYLCAGGRDLSRPADLQARSCPTTTRSSTCDGVRHHAGGRLRAARRSLNAAVRGGSMRPGLRHLLEFSTTAVGKARSVDHLAAVNK